MSDVVDYKKIIGKTILVSFISVLLALGVFVTIMICAFTKTTANFVYGLGMDRWASQLYYKVYQKDGDLPSGYKALSIKIKIDDYDKVIEYYESLVKDGDFAQFVDGIQTSNENLKVGILEKSTLLNENDYLRDNYVCALQKTGRVDDAFEIARIDFVDNYTIEFYNMGLYSLNYFAKDNGLNRFNDKYDGFEKSLVEELQIYFDNIIDLFEDNKGKSSDLDKSYLIALADRIMMVGQNVNAVYVFNETNADLVAQNKIKMTSVNEVVKGIL